MTASKTRIVCVSVPEVQYRRVLGICERMARARGMPVGFDDAVREGLMFWTCDMTRFDPDDDWPLILRDLEGEGS